MINRYAALQNMNILNLRLMVYFHLEYTKEFIPEMEVLEKQWALESVQFWNVIPEHPTNVIHMWVKFC